MIRRQSEQLLSGSKVDGPAPTALPDAAWLLLEYYFAFTQAWLPIVERQNILKTFYTYPTDNNHAELWSILALSAIQLKQATDGSYEDAKIRDFAQAQSRHSSGEASTNVRTTLLQVLLEMTCGEWQQAWMQIGSAIRTLLSLPSTNLQSLTLSAFVLESAIAHQLGISEVHLRPDYASAMGLLADDGVEEWAPWEDPLVATGEKPPTMALSTLNQLVRMTLRAYDSSGRLKLESDAASKAVVALLSNAVLTHGRLRPWAKLTTLEPEVALPPVLDGVEEDTSGLFEELAMLGHSDSDSHHSQFMQNLGFAPDLDLSEYFGRDYGVSRDGR
ncbi:hypothetical protein K470DRAFT_261828 [Piedraia hortae CBS 480.64]|uniref:Xylanolytic transcriptional activator regulatory domain-containing protein n=1 Tax=Piedraia hortae CBS 480.64 TaxID=1314780 RepID=A0A6A7C9B1_9PEZI|nr:hypothetical protein K470DRAFT_261828 [Piedraia hortae CBS 480.64]